VSELQKRVRDSISLTAKERYENLMQMHPEFLQRFPQRIIASYLGITQETLSRLRHHYNSSDGLPKLISVSVPTGILSWRFY